MGQQRIDQASNLDPCLLDHPLRQIGTSAAQRARCLVVGGGGLGDLHSIAPACSTAMAACAMSGSKWRLKVSTKSTTSGRPSVLPGCLSASV
jgi:hypothetical protein